MWAWEGGTLNDWVATAAWTANVDRSFVDRSFVVRSFVVRSFVRSLFVVRSAFVVVVVVDAVAAAVRWIVGAAVVASVDVNKLLWAVCLW